MHVTASDAVVAIASLAAIALVALVLKVRTVPLPSRLVAAAGGIT